MILLERMERDLRVDGRLAPGTAKVMWSAYAGYGLLFGAALTRRPRRRATSTTRTLGALLFTGGALLDLAGVLRFSGPRQLTGTEPGDLVTGGVHRFSRNPQYTGMLAALSGLTVARRSWPAALLTVGLGCVLRAWVPAEERHLSRQFPEDYPHYRASTPRWLGLPARKDHRGR